MVTAVVTFLVYLSVHISFVICGMGGIVARSGMHRGMIRDDQDIPLDSAMAYHVCRVLKLSLVAYMFEPYYYYVIIPPVSASSLRLGDAWADGAEEFLPFPARIMIRGCCRELLGDFPGKC